MIEHELLLLGLLKESPKHGYEIKKSIREMLLLFAGVNLKSIYYPLRVLEKKALIVKRRTRPTRHPARIVYALSPKGEKYFDNLLAKSFLCLKRPQFSLDLSLYFLPFIKPDVAKRRLRGRTLILRKLSKALKQTFNSFEKKGVPTLPYILEHNLKMLEAESKFLSELIKTF